MSDAMKDINAVAMAVIGLAMLAVFIKSQNTQGILQTGFQGFGNMISQASQG